MKIIVDAFGGDNAPLEILKGCAEAVKELDIDILLTGSEAEIRRVAKENDISLDRMETVSYTHLDVYKRQVDSCRARHSAAPVHAVLRL